MADCDVDQSGKNFYWFALTRLGGRTTLDELRKTPVSRCGKCFPHFEGRAGRHRSPKVSIRAGRGLDFRNPSRGGVDRTEGEPCPAVTPQPSASPAIAMERSGSTNHYASHPDQNQAQARDLRRSDVVAEHVAPDDNANCREHGPGYSGW